MILNWGNFFPLQTFLVVEHGLGASSIEWVDTKGTAAKFSTMHKVVPHSKEGGVFFFLSENVSSSKVEKLFPKSEG